MAWLRRGGTEAPPWAAPLDGREFGRFTRAVADALGRRAHTIDDSGVVHLDGRRSAWFASSVQTARVRVSPSAREASMPNRGHRPDGSSPGLAIRA